MTPAALTDLRGKTALVVGSTRGIGHSIAELFAACGARIIHSGRSAARVEAAVAATQAVGAEALGFTLDMTDAADVTRFANEVRATVGAVDFVIANAAVNPRFGSLAALPEPDWDRVMQANVKAVWQIANVFLPGMATRGGGAMIVISSISAFIGTANLGIYGTSKAAENGLVRSLAVEWGPRGITVNAIAPGVIRTEFSRALWGDERYARRYVAQVPVGRMGEPEDVAGLALLLVGPGGRFITGQSILVDGGISIADRG